MKKLYKFVFLAYLCLSNTIISATIGSGNDSRFENAANRNLYLPPTVAKNLSSKLLHNNTPTPIKTLKGNDGSASSVFKELSVIAANADFISSANANTCSSAIVNFTSQATGTGTLAHVWDFGDGSPTSSLANPGHAFTSFGCGTTTFNVTLTVTDATGSSSAVTKPVTIKQSPTIDFRDLDNSFTPFDNCRNASASAPSYTINVGNNSPSSCIANYSVNWGDGSPDQANVTFPAAHTYTAIGSYLMTITAEGSNGCSVTKTYVVKNVSNPSGGITSPGTTHNLCAPTAALQFAISGWGLNSPGTTYEINYGDGTPQVILTQEELMSSSYYNSSNPSASLNYPVPHSYENTSCPGNQLEAVLIIRNSCGQTRGSIANITILKKPIASFNAIRISCSDTTVLFNNTTTGGFNQNCQQELVFTWDFGDGSPIIITPPQAAQDVTHTYAGPGVYTVTLTAEGSCGRDTFVQQICIEDPILPQVNFDNVEGCSPVQVSTTNTTPLAGLCAGPTYLWTVNYTAGNCGSGTPVWSFTNGTNATSPSPSFSFVTPGTYILSLRMTNSCGPSQALERTIVVKQPPQAIINTIADVCGPSSITPSAVINSCAPASSTLSYAWSFPGGIPATSTLADPGAISYATTGAYTVSLIVTNECGASAISTRTFSVKRIPVLTTTPLSQTICSGSQTSLVNLTGNFPGVTYSWTATATAGVSGFLTSGNGNTIPVQTLTTTGSAIGTVTYSITASLDGCASPPVNYVVTINPSPFFTSQPVSSTVCQNGTVAPLTFSLNTAAGNPTYQWYSNTANSTIGGTPITGETGSTYNPSAATVGTLYYYARIEFTSGDCPDLVTIPASVNILAIPFMTQQPTPLQSVCVGGAISSALAIGYSGGFGTPTYQWYLNMTNSNSGGTAISGANSNTYSPPVFTSIETYYYYATITLSGSGCGNLVSDVAVVDVVADPVITSQPLVVQSLCRNGIPADLSVTVAGGIGTYSYQWFSNATNNTVSGTLIAGATNSTYTPPTNTIGTIYYYVVITQTGIGCSVTSNTAEVRTNIAPGLTTQPVSSTVCVGGNPIQLSVGYTNGIGTPSYQWYSNTVNTIAGAIAISGANSSTYSPSSALAGTLYYFATITFASSSCSVLTSAIATVTINPDTTISIQPIPTQTFCVGGSISSPLNVSYTGGTGTATYQWYSNTANSTTGGILIAGATNSTYTPPVFTSAGNYYYYVTVSLSGNGCDPAVSNTAEIIVTNDPIITLQPLAMQTICQNTIPTDLSVTVTGGVGTYSYQWYSNPANNNSTGTLIAGANSNSFTPLTNTIGTIYYYVIVNQTGAGCSVTSNPAQMIVNPIAVMTTQPVSSTVCQGGTPTLLSVGYLNGVGLPAYQWFINTTNSTVGASPISGATNSTFNPPSATAGTFYYFATISFSSTSGCGTLTSDIAMVIIAPETTITLQPIPMQTFCVGGSISAPLSVSYTGGTGTATYQWYSNTTNSTTGGTAITGATNSNYMPSVFATAGNYYYYVTVSLSGNGCDPAVSNTAEIIVVNDPVVTSQPLVFQELCEGITPTNLEVIVSGGVGSYSYQWHSNPVNNNVTGTPITGATNSSFTPPTNIVGTMFYYVVISQTGSGCGTVSNTAKVTVNPLPVITENPASSTVCQDQTANLLSVSYRNGAGTPSYQWYLNTTNSNTGGTPISGATNNTYAPPVNVAGIFYYYNVITFSSGSCSDLASDVAIVRVNPKAIISPKTRLICSGASFNLTPNTASGDIVPAGTLYTWTNPIVNPAGSVTGGFGQAVPQAFISQILTNNTNAPATATYTLTPISGSCLGAPFTLTVTVNPSINPNIVLTNSTCFGGNNGSIQTNITGGVPFTAGNPYQISWTGPNGFTSSAASISNLAPGTYILSVTETGGCPFSQSYVVSEPAEIAIQTDNEKDISCFGIADGAISITVSGGTSPYTYLWTKDNVPFSTSEDLSNLSPGMYTVTVFDANNCGPKTASFIITQPLQLEANLISKTDILCFGSRTGSINVAVVGGTTNYTFSWTGPNAFISSSQNLSALIAGTYNLTVTDRLGCTTALSVILTQPTELLISSVTHQISCYGANNGSISINMTGGVAPYQVLWSNLSTNATIQNLAPGTYRVTVTDANSCQKALNIVIAQPPIFMVNPVVANVSCNGANDGSINLNFVGGVSPVTVVWEDSITSNSVRNNLAPGTYNVLVTDAQGCQIPRSFVVLEPQPLVVTGTVNNAFNCNTVNSGGITLLATGGTAPYRYAWSNGSISQNLNNLPPGNYSVVVTDAKGCTQNRQFSIIRQQALTIAVKTDTIADCENQEVKQKFEAQVTGGVPPYQMHWSSGTVSGANNQFMETSQNGTIVLLVTDSVGCTDSYTFNVVVPEFDSPEFDVESEQFTIHGAFSIQDPILFINNTTGNYTSITWNFGDGAVSTEENPIHVYTRPGTYVVTQTIVYPFGCTIVHKMTLEITKGYRLIPPNGFTPNGDGINDYFAPLFSGLENVELSVYDTWGEMIYYEKGTSLKGWNGKLKNRDAENGNYYFKVTGTTFYGATVTENGPFTLIK